MDLQFLDGIDDDLSSLDPLELGKPGKKGIFHRKAASTSPAPKKKVLTQVKQAVKKGVHAVNRVNPATILLRNGVLASMKLNVMNVAGRLRWAYMSDQQAAQKKADPAKLARLREVKTRLENIFHGAGGKPENLKKAILEGKGNRDRAVPLSGLGYLPIDDLSGLNEYMPLSQLLGKDIYFSENMEGMDGIAGLGDPASASIASATGVLATLAAIIKSIGSIFPKGDKANQDFDKGDSDADTPSENTGPSLTPTQLKPGENGPITVRLPDKPVTNTIIPGSQDDAPQDDNTPSPGFENDNLPASLPIIRGDSSAIVTEDSVIPPSTTTVINTPPAPAPRPLQEFWDKNKKWLVPALWGVGGLGLIYFGYRALKPKKQTRSTPSKTVEGTSLTGLTSRKPADKKKKPGPKPKPQPKSKTKKGGKQAKKASSKPRIKKQSLL